MEKYLLHLCLCRSAAAIKVTIMYVYLYFGWTFWVNIHTLHGFHTFPDADLKDWKKRHGFDLFSYLQTGLRVCKKKKKFFKATGQARNLKGHKKIQVLLIPRQVRILCQKFGKFSKIPFEFKVLGHVVRICSIVEADHPQKVVPRRRPVGLLGRSSKQKNRQENHATPLLHRIFA